MTLIGAPVAFESDKAKQREVFKSCMEAKGYVVEPAPEGSPDTLSKLDTPATPASSVPDVDSLQIDWPAGFESQPPSDAQRRTGVIGVAINRTKDVSVVVVADRHLGVTDVPTYAESRRAAMLSRLGSASASGVTLTDVGGHRAFRCEGGGISNGMHLRGVETIIEGTEQLITVVAWTSEANWSNQADLMRDLPAKVTGRASARAFTSCGSTTVRVTAFITRRTVRRSSSSCAVAINEAKDIERAHAYWKDYKARKPKPPVPSGRSPAKRGRGRRLH